VETKLLMISLDVHKLILSQIKEEWSLFLFDQFKNIEFIAEGGFSKIYKATWIDGPISWYKLNYYGNISRIPNHTVVLKKLKHSKNITSRELNEVTYYTH
jgi:aspartyl/asparaginyl beta-hydroxylase (cupin superfamily)